MLDEDLKDKIEFVTSMSVAWRLVAGKDEATIRREAAKIAADAIEDEDTGFDPWKQEAVMEEVRRGIDKALAAG